MSSITKLREQIVTAEQHFGLFVEQHAKYTGHLIHLMNTVEERIQAQQDEVERQRAEIASLNEENEQLCDILYPLLQTIQAGSRNMLGETMQELGRKVSRLAEGVADEGKAPAVEAIAEVADAAEVAETKDSNIAAEASDESPGAGACAETDSPSSSAPAEGSVKDIMERVSKWPAETEVEPARDQQTAENEAEDVPVAAEDAALDAEVVPAEDRVAVAS